VSANLADLAGDPLDTAGARDEATVGAGTFGAMQVRFDGRVRAVAHLSMVLLYAPCPAAMDATHEEVGPRWATLAQHPPASAASTAAMVAAVGLAVAALRQAGRTEETLAAVDAGRSG
jgi:ferrous iron transport protein B